jgi:hypothetical protein
VGNIAALHRRNGYTYIPVSSIHKDDRERLGNTVVDVLRLKE